jgi:ATP-dependent DNA helicase
VHVDSTLWQELTRYAIFLSEMQNQLAEKAKDNGAPRSMMGTLNNMIMQLRKVANHPDLITGVWDRTVVYPPGEELKEQCGKFQLLDRLLHALFKKGHKVGRVPTPPSRSFLF